MNTTPQNPDYLVWPCARPPSSQCKPPTARSTASNNFYANAMNQFLIFATNQQANTARLLNDIEGETIPMKTPDIWICVTTLPDPDRKYNDYYRIHRRGEEFLFKLVSGEAMGAKVEVEEKATGQVTCRGCAAKYKLTAIGRK